MIYWSKGSVQDQQYLSQFAKPMQQLARCAELIHKTDLDETERQSEPCASHMMDQLELHIPLAQLIDDPQEEIARLEKNLKKTAQETERLQTKLRNKHFIAKAPATIVQRERAKLAKNQALHHQLQEKIQQLRYLSEKAS